MYYDYLVVGVGLFGAAFAQRMQEDGKSVLVIERRNHIGGNVYTEKVEGIQVHRYGAHIFHTDSKKAWEYVNRFAEFNRYTNAPIANYRGELYSLPFNMYTFHQMWGVNTPQKAVEIISTQRYNSGIVAPKNLEEQAISLVGTDIYEKLIKGYTEKQWGRPCRELPSFIIRRLPVRYTYDNNYVTSRYQGIPIGGYTRMVEKMLSGIEVRLNVDYLEDKAHWDSLADRVVYTGPIDAYFGYCCGPLAYRSVRFETEELDMPTDSTPYSTGIKVAIIVMFCLIPMIAWAATLWAMKGYSLTGAKMKEIQKVNAQRKQAIAQGMSVEEAMEKWN